MREFDVKENNVNFRGVIQLEFEIIKSCETIGGALSHLPDLFEKIKSVQEANLIILQLQKQLDEENLRAFENLQNAVDWIYEKLKLMKKVAKGNLKFLKRIQEALHFQTSRYL